MREAEPGRQCQGPEAGARLTGEGSARRRCDWNRGSPGQGRSLDQRRLESMAMTRHIRAFCKGNVGLFALRLSTPRFCPEGSQADCNVRAHGEAVGWRARGCALVGPEAPARILFGLGNPSQVLCFAGAGAHHLHPASGLGSFLSGAQARGRLLAHCWWDT